MNSWLQVIQIYLGIIINLLMFRNYIRVPLKVVILSGNEYETGLVQTHMTAVNRWYRDNCRITLNLDYDLRRSDSVPFADIHKYQLDKDDPVPTMYILPYTSVIDSNQSLGLWNNSSVLISSDGMKWRELYAHEIGHIFGLKHQENTFMNPITKHSDIGNITREQINEAQNGARLYNN